MTGEHDTKQGNSAPLSIGDALRILTETVEKELRHPMPDGDAERGVLKRFRIGVDMPDVLSWLSRQELYPRLYWMNREKSEWFAGLGEADRVELETTGTNDRSFSLLEEKLKAKSPSARYFGGFCFNNMQPRCGQWKAFSPYLFVLPLIGIESSGDHAVVTCSLWIEPGKDPAPEYRRLLAALTSLDASGDAAECTMPAPESIAYKPERPEWVSNCETVLKAFEQGALHKVILARQTELGFREPIRAIGFMLNYPFPESSTYRFYFEPEKGNAFISFTPERLYRRDGNVLLTEALAGTVTKEMAKADDTSASAMLLNSEKDVREHGFVRDTIYRELLPVCDDIEMEEETDVLQLNRLAHLYTRCRAKLKPEFSNDATVLTRLHPTPAVGGVPKDASMELIVSIEPFCRGWYAAPVGWLSRDAAEFAVGIRSALVNGNRAYLYSGAGIVKGSDPEAEWEEVDQKIGDILAITQQKA